ncbi:MAG: hypothetical protein M0T74_08250 [Desulfitobacterium hafniense]|nr:hypothetical protein [Desulfitobacterium hafniense]
MRIAAPAYNPVKECKSCKGRDESMVSSHILAFQVANEMFKLAKTYPLVEREFLLLELEKADNTLRFDLLKGDLSYGSVSFPLMDKYSPETGVERLIQEVLSKLELTTIYPLRYSNEIRESRYIFSILAKLIEVFHARCGLHIITLGRNEDHVIWELSLCEEGPKGWINSNGIAKNRFGDEINIRQWATLRPEKVATNIFGFNKFCSHYSLPRLISK